jgi:hypothetical protein
MFDLVQLALVLLVEVFWSASLPDVAIVVLDNVILVLPPLSPTFCPIIVVKLKFILAVPALAIVLHPPRPPHLIPTTIPPSPVTPTPAIVIVAIILHLVVAS